MPVKRTPDYALIAATVLLVLFGLVMVYSSSAVIAAERFGDPYHYLKRQAAWAVIGLAAMFTVIRIDYRRYQPLARPAYVVAVVLLALVLIPGIGVTINGARRWIDLGPLAFQPSEFVKLLLIISLAGFLVHRDEQGKLSDLSISYLPGLALIGTVFLLIQFQPDLGTAAIAATVGVFMLFVAGVRLRYLLGTALLVAPLLFVAVYNVDYRRRRILSFLDPWEDASDTGYQIIQSFVAIARGGVFGTGLGAGHQKLFYLPEPHTDFIFSIIAEELGLLGAGLAILLFAVLAWRGIRTGLAAPDRFGALLALGITFCVTLQAAVNLSVTMGLLPTKGLPLPFVSLGGSALVMWMTGVGMLLNVSEHAREK